MLNMELFTVSVSAPGKVILHGEHSVVYGKTAIAVSLGLRSSIVIQEVECPDEPWVHIHLPCVGLEERIPLAPVVRALCSPQLAPGITGRFTWRLPDKLDHDAHLRKVDEFLHAMKPNFDKLAGNQRNSLRCFLYVFSGIWGGAGAGAGTGAGAGGAGAGRALRISMGSELTIGAGTGSSASFAVCLAGALVRLLRLRGGAAVGGQGGRARAAAPAAPAATPAAPGDFTDGELEVISQWAYNCERIMHGSPSGIDNATCTYGAAVCFRRGCALRRLRARARLRVLLVDSRVGRETRALVLRVAALRQRHAPAVDCIMDACDHVARDALQLLDPAAAAGDKDDNTAAAADPGDTDADYARLAELWEMNHCLLAALGVSHPALEHIRGAARRAGLACKLTGAGGGGYAMVLVPPSTPRGALDALCGELLEHGFRVTETSLGGPGLRAEM